MPEKKLVSKVREHIAINKTDDALKALIDFLDQRKERFKQMSETARIISSDYYDLRQRQLQDTIKQEDYQRELNKIQSRMLRLADDLEEGRTKPTVSSSPSPLKNVISFLLLGAGLVILGLWLGGVSFTKPSKPTVDFSDKGGCPTFDPAATFKLLILPLKSFDGSYASFASSIKSGLDNITLNQPVSIKVHQHFDPKKEALPDFNEAEKIGLDCNAQMILWGTYEKPGDNYRVSLKYYFLGDDTQLKLHKLEVQHSSEIAVVDAVSSIQTKDFLTGDIKSIINIVAGMMAHKNENRQKASELLTAAQADTTLKDSTRRKVEFLLADNLMMDSNTYQEAIKMYNNILKEEPDNVWAHNNRGLLYFKLKRYPEAIKDFDITIKNPRTKAKDQVLLNILKSDAHRAIGQPHRASEDLIKAEEIMLARSVEDQVSPLIKDRMQTVKSAIESRRGIQRINPRILESQ